MSFLETVERARVFLGRDGRVSLRALQREFNLDDDALDALIEELAEQVDPDARQRQLFGVLRRLIQVGNAGEAIVTLVEDLHWIDRLPEREKQVLQTAAVIGRTFSEGALARALALIEETEARSYAPLVHEERAELARLLGEAELRERELREAHRLYTEMGGTGHAERLARELGL
jgi:hypothetical protein